MEGIGCCCGPCGSICVSYTCTSFPAYFGQGGASGIVVTVKQGATTIGSATTDGRIGRLTRAAAGAGYTNGTYTNGTFAGGGGTGGTFSYTISGGQLQATITVTNPGSGYTASPTAVLNAGTGAGAAITVDLGYWACVPISAAGTYQVSTTACGSATVNALCNSTNNTTIQSTARATVKVQGCRGLGAVGSYALTLSGNGYSTTITSPTGPYPSAGNSICVPGDGTFDVTYHNTAASNPAYQDASGTVTVTGCVGTMTLTLTSYTYSYTFTVSGCGGIPLAGATVVLTGSGGDTYTTNSSGQITATLPADCDYTATISKSRFDSVTTGTLTTAAGGGALGSQGLTPASGYRCLTTIPSVSGGTPGVGCCADPVPNTLYATDANGTHAIAGSGQIACWAVTSYSGLSYPGGAGGFGNCNESITPGVSGCSMAVLAEIGCRTISGVKKLGLILHSPSCRLLDGTLSHQPGICSGGNVVYSTCGGAFAFSASSYGNEFYIDMPTGCAPLSATFTITDTFFSDIVGGSVSLGE